MASLRGPSAAPSARDPSDTGWAPCAAAAGTTVPADLAATSPHSIRRVSSLGGLDIVCNGSFNGSATYPPRTISRVAPRSMTSISPVPVP